MIESICPQNHHHLSKLNLEADSVNSISFGDDLNPKTAHHPN